MHVILMLAGVIVGGVFGGYAGALAGVALGFAIGANIKLRARLDEIESALRSLQLSRTIEEEKPARRAEPRVAPVYEKEERQPASPPPAPRFERPPADIEPPPVASPHTPKPADTPQPAPLFTPASRPRYTGNDEPPALFTWIRDWFFGGNVVVRIGVLVLFIGVGFLLKFAAERNMLPIEFRLAGAALGGAALLIIGWRLRNRMRPYSLALQGGGIGLLYLTAFAALRFYDLLPPAATFAMLVAVAALSAFLAIGQNAMVLAVLGALGGFLAPVLTSTGQGNHVVLFSYYALLNAGIVAIAWFKTWRPLNLIAFLFTYGIGTAWGVLKYSPQHFATTEPFVILFFLMFLAVAVLFALRTAPRLTDYVDGTLVFGTPVMTMLLQSALVRDRPYAMAFSALALGGVYLLSARFVWNRAGEGLRLLAESFLALGVAFLTLAVPLALDGHWTAGTWALEGAAIFWVGMRQDRKLAIVSGLLLQLGAAFSYAIGYDVVPQHLPLANSEFVGALLIAIAGLVTARIAHLQRERLPEWLGLSSAVPLYWALVWWTFAGANEITAFLPERHWLAALLAFATATALGCAALSRWNDWGVARTPTPLLLPVMFVAAVVSIGDDGHFLARGGWIAWPFALGTWVWLLRWKHRAELAGAESALHVATAWFCVALVAVELSWWISQLRLGDSAWRLAVSGVVPAAALVLLLAPWSRERWPVKAHPDAYLGVAAGGLAAYLWLWVLMTCFDDASARPLPYLPLLNPVEIAQGFALVGIASWLLRQWKAPREWMTADMRRGLVAACAFVSFALLNAILLRIIHHVTGIAYTPDVLMASTLVQAALSIFWGSLALLAMVIGTRRGERWIWFTGATLLGIALAKMFLVDLSRTGTVARIVSFIGVGVLMLIIGRFSPVPPSEPEPEKA